MRISLRFAKRMGLRIAAVVAAPAVARRLLRDRGLIFMLHRFRNPDLGLDGHDPEGLRRSLDYLRGRGYELVALTELFRRLATAAPRAHGAIAFTMDDGYADQAAIGGAIFAEFDCPVTTFPFTGFLDGTTWGWWDRVAYIFGRCGERHIRVQLADQVLDYICAGVGERDAACRDFTARCKRVPTTAAEEAILSLATEAGVALPAQAPEEFAPMSWEDLRRCEERGMTFGPHTVTHPILSRADDHQADWEIAASWERLRREARAPVPVFCYPNGQPDDFGQREINALARLGMVGAVVGTPGYAEAGPLRGGSQGRFLVPRYQWPDTVPELAQYAAGFERVKQWVLGRP